MFNFSFNSLISTPIFQVILPLVTGIPWFSNQIWYLIAVWLAVLVAQYILDYDSYSSHEFGFNRRKFRQVRHRVEIIVTGTFHGVINLSKHGWIIWPNGWRYPRYTSPLEQFALLGLHFLLCSSQLQTIVTSRSD